MKTRTILLHAILFLFFIQLLTDFIAAIYAFGLLGTSIPPELGFALLLFAPALLLLTRRPGPRLLAALAAILFLARVLEPALDTRPRLMVAGAGVAAWLMLFPLLLWRETRIKDEHGPQTMAAGLLLATLLSIVLRVWGSGVDGSAMGWGQALGAGLALTGGWLWWKEEGLGSGLGVGWDERGEDRGGAPFWRVTLLSLGLMAVLTLIYFAFAAPYVMARWTGVDAFWVLLTLLTVWTAFAWMMTWLPTRLPRSRGWLIVWNLAFALALFLTLSNNLPWLPLIPHLYPRPASMAAAIPCCADELLISPPWDAIWYGGPLGLLLLFSPILFLDFQHLANGLTEVRPSLRQLAGAFTLASLFLLLAIFANVFTTAYDYIPVIGPLFRNGYPLVYFLTAWMLLPALGIIAPKRMDRSNLRGLYLSVVLLMLVALGTHEWLRPSYGFVPPEKTLTILTYNIQQGYSEDGRKNYAGQLAQIQAIQPDIIGLQESDTARIANSNDDIVRYFANHLHMYSYYGPKTVAGTFGIALLSRYPIVDAQTFYLYSEGEQVAALVGVIDVGWDAPITVWVTHLGNGGPMIQQQQFLQLVGDGPRTLALGDFNFRPDSPQYALTTRHLLDSWTQKWPDWEDDWGQKPERKIDHIFISSDWRVLDARYYPAGPSDHPAVTAVVGR